MCTLSVGGLLTYAEQIARRYSQSRRSLSTAIIEDDGVASDGGLVLCNSDSMSLVVAFLTWTVRGTAARAALGEEPAQEPAT